MWLHLLPSNFQTNTTFSVSSQPGLIPLVSHTEITVIMILLACHTTSVLPAYQGITMHPRDIRVSLALKKSNYSTNLLVVLVSYAISSVCSTTSVHRPETQEMYFQTNTQNRSTSPLTATLFSYGAVYAMAGTNVASSHSILFPN